jgi:hypothetical protein
MSAGRHRLSSVQRGGIANDGDDPVAAALVEV